MYNEVDILNITNNKKKDHAAVYFLILISKIITLLPFRSKLQRDIEHFTWKLKLILVVKRS